MAQINSLVYYLLTLSFFGQALADIYETVIFSAVQGPNACKTATYISRDERDNCYRSDDGYCFNSTSTIFSSYSDCALFIDSNYKGLDESKYFTFVSSRFVIMQR